jgi:hypothetical protein
MALFAKTLQRCRKVEIRKREVRSIYPESLREDCLTNNEVQGSCPLTFSDDEATMVR